MICVWLIESGVFSSAALRCLHDDQVKVGLITPATMKQWIFPDFATLGPKSRQDICSLDYFGNRRTDTNVSSKFQGVETPSQSRLSNYGRHWQFMAGHWESCPETLLFSSTFSIRYVAYYEKMKSNGRVLPEAVPLTLTQNYRWMFNSNARDTQNNFRPHVLWSRGRLWLLFGDWSGHNEFAKVEKKIWFLILILLYHWIGVVLRVGEIQSSALTLGTCWTASQSMMLALTCLLFRWFKSCKNPFFNIGTKIRLSLPI